MGVRETFILSHTRKDGKGFVDRKSQEVVESFDRERQRAEEAASSGQEPMPDEYTLWVRAVGGKKKGRVYGVSDAESRIDATSTGPSTPTSAAQDITSSPAFQDLLRRHVHELSTAYNFTMQEDMQTTRTMVTDIGQRVDAMMMQSQRLEQMMYQILHRTGGASSAGGHAQRTSPNDHLSRDEDGDGDGDGDGDDGDDDGDRDGDGE